MIPSTLLIGFSTTDGYGLLCSTGVPLTLSQQDKGKKVKQTMTLVVTFPYRFYHVLIRFSVALGQTCHR